MPTGCGKQACNELTRRQGKNAQNDQQSTALAKFDSQK